MNKLLKEFRWLIKRILQNDYIDEKYLLNLEVLLSQLPEELTLDVTKPIRTRGGDQVEIITFFGQGDPIVGYILGSGTHVHTWNRNGEYGARGDVSTHIGDHEWDLVND